MGDGDIGQFNDGPSWRAVTAFEYERLTSLRRSAPPVSSRQLEHVCHPPRHHVRAADQHEPLPLADQFAEQAGEVRTAAGVQADERVVEHQQFRLREECPGQPRSPRLAIRKRDERLGSCSRTPSRSAMAFSSRGGRVRTAAEELVE